MARSAYTQAGRSPDADKRKSPQEGSRRYRERRATAPYEPITAGDRGREQTYYRPSGARAAAVRPHSRAQGVQAASPEARRPRRGTSRHMCKR